MNLKLFSIPKLFLPYLPVVYAILCISCGKEPASIERTEHGAVVLKSQIIRSLLKSKHIQGTSFDSLIVEINASDFSEPIHRSFPINNSSLTAIDTVNAVPAGALRVVKVWTTNSSGNVIHRDSIDSHSINIEPGKCVSLAVNLIPFIGSIYLQLGSIPTTVDSIEALFTSDSGIVWQNKVRRNNRIYLTIDNIPHQTSGTLQVTTYGPTGIQLQQATSRITFNAIKSETVAVTFTNNDGFLSLNARILLPAATVVSGSLGASEVAAFETGECIITEIMYSANDSEYIEIYNTTSMQLHFDTLTLDIDGARRHFSDITIESHDYFVFGRKELPWIDRFHNVQTALDLSTNGNWITLRSQSAILDQVIFSNGNSGLDWPDIKDKRSMELDPQHYSSSENNFGRFWKKTSTLLASSDHMYGTPGNR